MNDLPRGPLLAKLGYQFSNSSLFELALTHRSCGSDNNERLEFLGDSLLNTIIAEALFQRFPTQKEGQLSRLRASLVKGETLAELAREFQVGDYLRLGEGELKSGGFRRASLLADALEAIIAAIYLDSNFETCRASVLRWFANRLTTVNPASTKKDPKSELQELLQGKGLPLPEYQIDKVQGAAHAQTFTVVCQVSLLPEPVIMQGSSRRGAEKAAAEEALKRLASAQ